MSKVSSLSVLFKWNTVKTSSNKTSPRSRCKHTCCLHNEFIYLIGGKDKNVSLKDFWRFNIGTNKWEELSYRGEKIPYFEGHSIVSHKRLLLLFGGVFDYDNIESALWIINPDLNYIRRHVPDIGTSQPCTRRHHTAVLYNNVMYVYGGFIDLKGSTSEIWAYHIDDEEWELITPNQRQDNTAGSRHAHSAVVHGREMWVFGGMSGLQSKSDFWRFNFHSLKWDRIKTKFGPPCLSGHTASVVKEYMVIVGGESNGVLSSDIWVFGFCTLKWTHYQNSHQFPAPRKWHCVIPITARFRKGDNSVRTTSLPHLQKNGRNNIVRRPKSSPVYYSARFSRKPSAEIKQNTISRPITLAINMTNNDNQNNSASQFVEMTDFHKDNVDRRSPFKGNGFSENNSKPTEERSPLLCNRQASRDSVTSNGSGLGADNPCLELNESVENVGKVKFSGDDSTELTTSFELQDLSPKKERKYSKNNNQTVTRFVKNQKYTASYTSYIPGQVNLSPPTDRYTHSGNDFLVVEDLEFCDDHFAKEFRGNQRNLSASAKKYLISSDYKSSSNQDLRTKLSDDHDLCETEFVGRVGVQRENSLEEKSYSMSDISQSNSICSDSIHSKSLSMHLPQPLLRRRSLNCWMEEAESSTEENAVPSGGVPNKKTAQKVSTNHGKDDTQEKQNKTTNTKDGEENVAVENGQPYFLLIGGLEEKKGFTVSAEPITIWQCDVMVRHSDISHGPV